MKLEEGVYSIPADCTVLYVDRQVVVQKKKRQQGLKHCGDCIHQLYGKKTIQNQWYASPYCELKPKIINGRGGYFYNANSNKTACEMFEQKEQKEQ